MSLIGAYRGSTAAGRLQVAALSSMVLLIWCGGLPAQDTLSLNYSITGAEQRGMGGAHAYYQRLAYLPTSGTVELPATEGWEVDAYQTLEYELDDLGLTGQAGVWFDRDITVNGTTRTINMGHTPSLDPSAPMFGTQAHVPRNKAFFDCGDQGLVEVKARMEGRNWVSLIGQSPAPWKYTAGMMIQFYRYLTPGLTLPIMQFVTPTTTMVEGTIVDIPLMLSPPETLTRSVRAAILVDGTAEPTDYSLTGLNDGAVLIGTGGSGASLHLAVPQTAGYEAERTVVLTLDTPINAWARGIITHTVIIKDHYADYVDPNGSPVVTNTNDAGVGSLRSAIKYANANPGHTVTFNIPTEDPGYDAATGTFTIRPTTTLPPLVRTGNVIDGSSQTAFSGDTNPLGPEIVISGSASTSGLCIADASTNCGIKGLVVNGYSKGTAAAIDGQGGWLKGCYVGTNAAGTAAAANKTGVSVSGTGASVGGTSSEDRNLISGNTYAGIRVGRGSGNTIRGNYIGTNASGTGAVANYYGVMAATGDACAIGGDGVGNVISGNSSVGVYLGADATNTVVQGNLIGTNVTGLGALPNNGAGIEVSASGALIGGTATGQRNVVSGNVQPGIWIRGGAHSIAVRGNYIGVGSDGVTPMANMYGLYVSENASGNTIGGLGQGNVIARNRDAGVAVGSGSGNCILGNSIHTNGGLGIDLGATGATANDAGDGDTGANNLMNFPVVTSVTPDGVSGTLDSGAPGPVTIHLYQNDAADPSGYGEGQTYLGAATVSGGAWSLSPSGLVAGKHLSATATDADGNTSEFSATYEVGDPVAQFTSASQSSTDESGSMTATVALSWASSQTVTVPFTVSGTATDGTDYTITQSPITVAAGSTTGTITIDITEDTSSEGDETVVITLGTLTNATASGTTEHTATITEDDLPAISLSPTSFSFTGTHGAGNPADQSLAIANDGSGTLDWAVSDDAAWLTLSPASGTDAGTATLSVSIAGLDPGSYSATATVSATGATNTPQTCAVTLAVGLADPVMDAEPAFTPGSTNTVSCGAVSGADEYRFQCSSRHEFPAGGAGVETSAWGAATSHEFTGLEAGVKYAYRAQARKDGVVSAWSDAVASRQGSECTLTYTGDTTKQFGQAVALSAQLKKGDGTALAGQRVGFVVGAFSGVATTDGTGTATVTVPAYRIPVGTHTVYGRSRAGSGYSVATCEATLTISARAVQDTIIQGEGWCFMTGRRRLIAKFRFSNGLVAGYLACTDVASRKKIQVSTASTVTVQPGNDEVVITGPCTVNGASTTFTLTVVDSTNSFRLQTGNGYDSGTRTLRGDIAIAEE